ncbi:MAG: tRNA uridine-5-carboxymethylaminomethyl(34) synthesis GTPase MnmE [Selenomonadaceae bacterium]|nr:tRNA uridine-5-carboxymethylaminomethyl(34) synthesis GTPase MnmE [Selenomonadaceae bacterium]
MKQNETISAIATAAGAAGIGVIRLSGATAIDVADKIFCAANHKKLRDVDAGKIVFGHVKNFNGEIVDEVIVLVMCAPKSYTKEDVVEIQCHGGSEVLREILNLTFQAGARPAERGEFTKRAFLNGRIDLSQAQAVLDVIQAKTSAALNIAQNRLSGKTSKKIRDIRQNILNVLAHIDALIDFPEDDIDDVVLNEMDEKISAQIDELEKFLKNRRQGKILREGLSTAIIGKPNVGKSSLLNFLTDSDRAIVTEIPGTTRDSSEEFINVGGVPLKIIDTAGIRNSGDVVEQIGIDRARDVAANAELVLALFDGSRPLTDEDAEIFKLLKPAASIILLTKSDLPQVSLQLGAKNYRSIDPSIYRSIKVIHISTKTGAGIDELLAEISKMVGVIDAESTFVRDEREADILRRAVDNLKSARETIKSDVGIDFVSIDLRAALELFGEITGETVTDDVINEIFSKFCIGK